MSSSTWIAAEAVAVAVEGLGIVGATCSPIGGEVLVSLLAPPPFDPPFLWMRHCSTDSLKSLCCSSYEVAWNQLG